SAAELGLGLRQCLALVLRLEDAVPVGVQGAGPAVAAQPALGDVHVRLDGALPVETRHQIAGGVVDHGNQDELLAPALQPVVDGGIQLHQFPEAGAARSSAAVCLAAAFAAPQS